MDELLQLELTPITNARYESIGGRSFVVATAIILREQVLNGSDGPLFYPLSEVTGDVGVWNGYPVTAKHPSTTLPDGSTVPASARSPKIAHAYQIGTVYNDRVENGERVVDLYIDVQNANRIDDRIVPAIKAGKRINVSTGIFTGKIVENARHNGREYTHRVKGIKPDHLAVLMDEKGACSVNDGCGINVNSEGQTVNKDQLVTWLVANCDCWKGDKSKETLNALDETQLKGLKQNAEAAKTLTLTNNALKTAGIEVTDPTKLPEAIKTNAMGTCPECGGRMKDKTCPGCGYKQPTGNAKVEPKPAPTDTATVTKEQVTNALRGMSEREVLELFPALKQTINTAKDVVEKERVEVINKLTAHFKDPEERKAKILKLKDKDLPTLNEMLEFSTANGKNEEPKDADSAFLANFFGSQGTVEPQKPRRNTDPSKVLPPAPTVNFEDE